MSDRKSIWDDPRITAYVLGEMSDHDITTFRDEIENDPELAAAVDQARSVTGRLTELYADEPTTELDTDRRETITRESDGEGSPRDAAGGPAPAPSRAGTEASLKRSAMPKLLLATAAVVLLLVGIAPLMSRWNERTLSQTSADETATEVAEEWAMATDSKQVSEQLEFRPRSESPRALVEAEEGESQLPEATSTKAAESYFAETDMGNSLMGDRPATMPMEADDAMPADESSSTAAHPFARELSPAAPVASGPTSGQQFRREAGAYAGRGQGAPRIAKAEKVGKSVAGVPSSESATAAPTTYTHMEGMMGRGGMGGGVTTRNVTPMQRGPTTSFETRIPGQPVPSTPNYGLPIDEGRGPGIAGDQFDPITDNPFKRVAEHPLSTFSIDVDTASYSKVRDFLMRANQLPRPDAVRIEELVNYFDYNYQPPANDAEHPFAAHTVITDCPWNEGHQLARIGLKGKTMTAEERPKSNLVFLLDTSGSMNAANKLPLVVDGMKMLLKQLNDDDKVAITVYAGSAGLVLDSTKASKSKKIRKALTQLRAGGSTNGGSGISLAYQTARDNYIPDGVNRVILCTDGDFNVGTTGTDELVRMVEREAKGGIFLSVLGFGMGNHNDAMLEQISNRGNGNYSFIDTEREARKVLVDQTSATLVTIAKDVKIQVEFNPRHVSSYRLIGYENRILAKEDFNDDKKDAGEIGAGHTVTALYELVPAGKEPDAAKPKVDELTFQTDPELTEAAQSDRWMLLKLRYKQPEGETSTLVKFPVTPSETSFGDADQDVRFAAAVAGFGMQLRRSEYQGDWTLSDVRKTAQNAIGEDKFGLRAEFVKLVEKASSLMGEE